MSDKLERSVPTPATGFLRDHENEDEASSALRARGSSISFAPKVKIEGEEHPLKVIRADVPKEPIIRGVNRRALRAVSDSERLNYDPSTGEKKGSRTNLDESSASVSSARDIPTNPAAEHAMYTRSLVHSPSIEEVMYGGDGRAIAFPLQSPHSLQDSSGPSIFQNLEKTSLPTETSGKLRRAHSQRALDGTSYKASTCSPASQFLSMFAEVTTPAVNPDDEGQEVDSYVIGKQIGYGSYSVVKEAFTFADGVQVRRAVKIVRKNIQGRDVDNDKIQGEFEHEIALWKCLSHKHILSLISVHDMAFATFAFIPYIGTTLYDLLRANRKGFESNRARIYCHQIATAVRYLHEDARVVHRDIKPENCLVDEDTGNILLCDFGMAQFLPSEGNHIGTPTSEKPFGSSDLSVKISHAADSMGSVPYASPEVIQSGRQMTAPAVDIWAFGVVMHAIYTGDLPFQHSFQPRLQMMIARGEWDKNALLAKCGATVMEVVGYCLQLHPEHRWSGAQILQSELFHDLPFL